MPSSSAGRLCVWKKCSAAKFREVLFGCKQTYFPEDPMILQCEGEAYRFFPYSSHRKLKSFSCVYM